MLQPKQEFFGSDEVAAIKVWLSQPGAALFRKAMQNEIAHAQIEASNEAIKALEPGKMRFEGDAAEKLKRVRDLTIVLTEIDRAASKDFKPFVTKVITT